MNQAQLSQAYLDLLKKALTASLYEESSWQMVGTQDFDINASHSRIASLRQGLKNAFARALSRRGVGLVRKKAFNRVARESGQDWPFFAYSMAGHRRLENVQACLEDILAKNVPGDLIETGAWRGGTTIFMRAVLKVHGIEDRSVWVADSFEGLPPPENQSDGWDLSEVDYLKVSLEQVQANFAKFDLLDDQVKFLKGWFCDTLPSAPIDSLAILRLDGDLYSSTMDALKNLYPKVSVGGYIIVDDYYSWPACRQAVTDFIAENSLSCDIKQIDAGGAYWQRE